MRKLFRPGWPRRFSLLAIFLFIYALLGFAVLPLIIKSQIDKQLNKSLNAKITVEDVDFNPFALSLSISGLNAKDLEDHDLFSFSEFYLNFQLRSIIERAYTFSLVSLDGLKLSAGIQQDGNFNFKNLLKVSEPSTQEDQTDSKMPNLIFDRIILNASSLNYFDKRNNEDFTFELQPLEFSLSDFNTGSDKSATVSLKTENGKTNLLSYSGNFSLAPLKADGKITLSIQEPGYAASYFLRSINLSPLKAEINLTSDVSFNSQNDKSEFLFDTSEFKISKVELKDSYGNPLANLPELSARLGFDMAKQQFKVQNFRAADAEIFLSMDQEGKLNFASLSKPSETDTAPKSPLKILVEDAKLEKFRINYQQQGKNLKFEDFSLNVFNFDSAASGKIKAGLDSSFADGRIKIDLDGTLTPVNFSSGLKLSKVNLAALSPWIESAVNANLKSGFLDAECALKASDTYSLSGKLTAGNYLLQADNKPVAGWDELTLDSFKWDSESNLLSIDTLELDKPLVAMKIDKSGKFVVIEPKAAEIAPQKKDEVPDSKAFRYAIKNVKFEKGQFDFRDDSVGYRVNFSPLNAQIAGLESSYSKTIRLKLDSSINGQGKVDYAGYLTLGSSLILQNGQLRVSDLDMLSLSPYSLKFIGRPINGGKLNLTAISQTNGDDVNGENTIILDRFYLGSETGGSSIGLPISTALSIMRDGSDKITLNLPVRGNVKSAGMSYRSLVYKSFENLILEVVASPLTILGSIYNFNTEELSHIDFEPEESELSDKEKGKLDLILKAMADKKALKIEIRSVVAAGADSSSKVWDEDLQELAGKRVSAIRDYLLKDGILTSERIYVVAPDLIIDDKLKEVPSRLRITS